MDADDPRLEAGPADPAAVDRDPPFQALFPNLDHVSRSSFAKGSVSRRRITRAAALLAVIPIVVVAAIVVPQLLNG